MPKVLEQLIKAASNLRGHQLFAFLISVAIFLVGSVLLLTALDSTQRLSALPLILVLAIAVIIANFIFIGPPTANTSTDTAQEVADTGKLMPSPRQTFHDTKIREEATDNSVESVSTAQRQAAKPNQTGYRMQESNFSNLTLEERNALSRQLVRSERINSRETQIALCQEIGIKGYTSLDFVGTPANAFATRLVNYLYNNQDAEALRILHDIANGSQTT